MYNMYLVTACTDNKMGTFTDINHATVHVIIIVTKIIK